MSTFHNLETAFRDELRLWPPSEQSFDESLMKAKTHGQGTQRARLSAEQKTLLRHIYEEARQEELRAKFAPGKERANG